MKGETRGRLGFGVFDHLDRNPAHPLAEQYEARLQMVEVFDHAGFYSYHVAQHHLSRVGIAPSPSVFLFAHHVMPAVDAAMGEQEGSPLPLGLS